MRQSIQQLLTQKNHRPWKQPAGRWKFYQEWNNSLFLHWKVNLNSLSELVHPDLEIDQFDGDAWVSLVAFDMEKIRPRSLPSVSLISNFPEINIRTYVKYKGKSGVYFLSIEGAKSLSCKIAKQISELPYRYSRMSRNASNFQSINSEFSDRFKASYSIGTPIKTKTKLDEWLTERYALFQDGIKCINAFDIHHTPWPLYQLNLTDLQVDYPRFEKLFDHKPDEIHYSTGVQVIVWGREKHEVLQTKLTS